MDRHPLQLRDLSDGTFPGRAQRELLTGVAAAKRWGFGGLRRVGLHSDFETIGPRAWATAARSRRLCFLGGSSTMCMQSGPLWGGPPPPDHLPGFSWWPPAIVRWKARVEQVRSGRVLGAAREQALRCFDRSPIAGGLGGRGFDFPARARALGPGEADSPLPGLLEEPSRRSWHDEGPGETKAPLGFGAIRPAGSTRQPKRRLGDLRRANGCP